MEVERRPPHVHRRSPRRSRPGTAAGRDGDVGPVERRHRVATEEFAQHRALIWARLRRAGHGPERRADAPEISQPERDSIVAEFLASKAGQRVRAELSGADVGLLASYLVNLRCDYEGRPFRWSPNVVGMLLLDLAPRKLLLDPDDAAALTAVLRAFVRFAGERTGLDTVFIDEILAAADEAEPEFHDRIGDPGAAGPAKAVLAALQARGVDFNDLDAVNANAAGARPHEAARARAEAAKEAHGRAR